MVYGHPGGLLLRQQIECMNQPLAPVSLSPLTNPFTCG
jgi:hypothetical protein